MTTTTNPEKTETTNPVKATNHLKKVKTNGTSAENEKSVDKTKKVHSIMKKLQKIIIKKKSIKKSEIFKKLKKIHSQLKEVIDSKPKLKTKK